MIVQGPGFRVLGNAPEHDLKLLEPYKPPAADTERETQQLDTPQTLHSTLYTLRKPCICASVSERLSSMYGVGLRGRELYVPHGLMQHDMKGPESCIEPYTKPTYRLPESLIFEPKTLHPTPWSFNK